MYIDHIAYFIQLIFWRSPSCSNYFGKVFSYVAHYFGEVFLFVAHYFGEVFLFVVHYFGEVFLFVVHYFGEVFLFVARYFGEVFLCVTHYFGEVFLCVTHCSCIPGNLDVYGVQQYRTRPGYIATCLGFLPIFIRLQNLSLMWLGAILLLCSRQSIACG